MPGIQDDELLVRFIRGCNQPIRLELERVYSDHKGRGKTLDLMEAIRLAETEDRFAVKKSIFSHKKNRFERKYLAYISGDGGGDSSSSDGEKEKEMSKKDDRSCQGEPTRSCRAVGGRVRQSWRALRASKQPQHLNSDSTFLYNTTQHLK